MGALAAHILPHPGPREEDGCHGACHHAGLPCSPTGLSPGGQRLLLGMGHGKESFALGELGLSPITAAQSLWSLLGPASPAFPFHGTLPWGRSLILTSGAPEGGTLNRRGKERPTALGFHVITTVAPVGKRMPLTGHRDSDLACQILKARYLGFLKLVLFWGHTQKCSGFTPGSMHWESFMLSGLEPRWAMCNLNLCIISLASRSVILQVIITSDYLNFKNRNILKLQEH